MDAVGHFTRDFLAREKLGGALQDVRERQRVVHHEALHTGLPVYDGTDRPSKFGSGKYLAASEARHLL